ncbi:uncharacterized protein C18orf63 homolog isoform X2 [Archocentrus centrarchus]|uniref:uncharacterized protein C18orf63 homolog isoform X2 n=1 Tax=Archocentrus centrarchus TaxID=63155 RepID=UPI0011EA4E71|nr:uncharacterized protein C18orf63 homolog isoform X2 [Archocentrus centrarchus]
MLLVNPFLPRILVVSDWQSALSLWARTRTRPKFAGVQRLSRKLTSHATDECRGALWPCSFLCVSAVCRMSSADGHQSLHFLGLPDLKQLICITLTLQEEDEEPRSKQIKTCRELVLLFSDVLASPALDSFVDITVVIATSFFQKGMLQVFGQRRRLQLGSLQGVFPGDLQRCLSYSLITRLSPSWTKAGLYLISGKDFLTERGRLNAVSLELSAREGQMCFSIEASTVRLPPTTLEDFGLPPLVLWRFCSDPDFILDLASTRGALWCHVLPSMKRGQIISISRQLPRDGPFRSYRDLQNHWKCMYGYRLPELVEEEVVYCSVYFRLVGERLFTYPLSCIRLRPVQRCPRVDLQGTLGSFLSDIGHRLKTVCGFPARLSSRPCYRAVSLSTAASVQVESSLELNLTTSCPIRPVFTQLPPPPPSQPLRSSFGSQPAAWTPLSQQEEAQELLEKRCGFKGRLTQSQGCRGDGDWSSSSSSISSSYTDFSFSDSSGYESQYPFSSSSSSSSSFLPHFQPASCLSSSSFSTTSSPFPVFQPASSLTSSSFSKSSPSHPVFQPASFFSSSISSSVIPPTPPLSQVRMNPAPKLVPTFKNKHQSHHANIALLRVQKQKKQLGGGGAEPERVTLPSFGKKIPATAPPLSSLTAAALPAAVLSPPIIPHFSRRRSSHSSATATSANPNIKHISSLSPVSKLKPRIIIPPKPEIKPKLQSISKTISKVNSEGNAVTNSGAKMQEEDDKEPLAPTSSDASNEETSKPSKKRVGFDSKLKKSRATIRDVEKMARTNQVRR